MKVLLDTHLLLWAAGMPERLPAQAREVLERAETEPMVSAASLWEVAIKSGLGRADFSVDPRLLRRGLLILLTTDHVVARYPGPIRAV